MRRTTLSSSARTFRAVLACMGVMAAGCAQYAAPPAAVEQQEWTSPAGDQGVQILTQHFDLRVTAKDPVLREYLPTFMEDAYAAYERTILPAEATSSQPAAAAKIDGRSEPALTSPPSQERLIVYLFDTRDQWATFTRGFSPANAETYLHILSGGYTDYPTATAVAFDLHRDRTLSLLAHEGFHQYLARNFPQPVSAWVNEGLATQFEAFELNGPHPNFTPRRNYTRRNNLRELVSSKGQLIPLAELLRMDAGQAVRGKAPHPDDPRQTMEGPGTRAYYAQVWSLVLFLKEGPAPIGYRESFARLLGDLGSERMTMAIHAQRAATAESEHLSDGELLFRNYIAEDLAKAESDYRAFAEALLR